MFELFASTREDVAMLGWDEATLGAFLRMQYHSRETGYAIGYAGAKDEIVEFEGKKIGRMMALRGEKQITFIDFALLPEFRSKGIGTYLMRLLFAEATAASKPIELNVKQANPAKRLYERTGFLTVSEDDMYCTMIKDPCAD